VVAVAADRTGPLAFVETLRAPGLYSAAQIRLAFDICIALDRGKLVYTMPPELA
jgi:hypothetical protein